HAYDAELEGHVADADSLGEEVDGGLLCVREAAEEGEAVGGLAIEGWKAAGDVGEAGDAADPVDHAGDGLIAEIFHDRHLRAKGWVSETRASYKISLIVQQRADQFGDVGWIELAVAVDVDDEIRAAAHGVLEAGA